MRLAIIIGKKHGEDDFSIVVEPTTPDAANTAFKKLLHEGDKEYAEIQLWDSGQGIRKSKKFQPPPSSSRSAQESSSSAAPVPAPAEDISSDEDGPTLAPSKSKRK